MAINNEQRLIKPYYLSLSFEDGQIVSSIILKFSSIYFAFPKGTPGSIRYFQGEQ